MTPIEADQRSSKRRMQDEQISCEPQLPALEVPPDAIGSPMETHLTRPRRHPVARSGVVENGLVRLFDPDVKLPERSRVVVVAKGA
jgi:hypothetical protein